MRKIVEQFVKFPFYANLIIVAVLIAGLSSLFSMKKSFFPEYTPKNITVTVFYPGASPKEMEEGVTQRVEEALRSIVGIKEVNSTSSENFCMVAITTTGEYDLDVTLAEVKNAVDGISSFPVDAERPIVFKQRSVSQAMYIGLTGETDLMSLKQMADEVEFDFRASGVMSQINVNGLPALEIAVEASEEILLRYNLSFDEIIRAIMQNNQDVSGGLIRSSKEEVLIRSRNRSVEPDIIADIVIRADASGQMIRIRDVATVRRQFAEGASSSFMNGKRSVSISVQKLPEEDLEVISSWITNYVHRFNELHEGVEMVITYDFLEMLGARLKLLYNNGGVGLLLVLLALGLFLSFRLSFWVAFGIPISFMAMFIVAQLNGITINMISLFGMILVIGILVDDGIVIAENIFSHFERGKSPRRAAIDGMLEVYPAVLTSVLTTIIAFMPLLFIEGRMEFMYEMAFVVIMSLLFSLIEAFFILPAHLGSERILRRNSDKHPAARMRKVLNRGVMFMRERIYGRILRLILTWKYVALVIPVGLILITAGLFGGGVIKATFFPSIPFDQFNVDLAFKPGTGEPITLKQLQQMDDAIWAVNSELMEEFEDSSNFVNFTFLSTGSAFNGQENGAHAGNIFVVLRDLEDAAVNSYEIVNRVREKIGAVPEAEKYTVAGRNTFGDPIAISLLGKDLRELREARDYLSREMEKIEAVNNITDNNALGKREIRLQLKPKAYFLGFTQMSLLNQVRQGFFGGQAQRLQHGKNELRVWVRYPQKDRLNVGQLEKMKIKTAFGEYPLTELAEFSVDRGPVSIKHFNGQREVRVTAGLVDALEPIPPILEKIRQDIIPPMQARYPGVDVTYQGQQRDSNESMTQVKSYFTVAFALMILLVMIHFKSAAQALIIIMMIPMAWLGASWGHGIEGIPLSMLSVWGMVALSGVVINDAVVFLQKYNSLLLEGLPVVKATYEAGVSRFRAIVLTSITTVVGLYPIILEKSFQAQFLRPMAVALAYGVLFGTAFILLFFPVLILVVNDIRRFVSWLVHGVWPEREAVEKTLINARKKID